MDGICVFLVGFRLIQEVETLFGTDYLIVERFLKSSSKVWSVIVGQNRSTSRSVLESIMKESNEETGIITGYPAVEALVDALKPVYEAVVLFQTCNKPALHKVLPNLQYCIEELSKIERGEVVFRDENRLMQPSLYSKGFCSVMVSVLKTIEIRGLWIVGCLLYLFKRDMNVWPNSAAREELKRKGESFNRELCEKQPVDGSALVAVCENGLNYRPNLERNGRKELEPFSEAPLKRKKFSLKYHVLELDSPDTAMDEVSRYKTTPVHKIGLNQESFASNPFSVVQLWYTRKRSYPELFWIAMRVFSALPSSFASECVFAIVEKTVTADRNLLPPVHLSSIIVARSMSS